MTTETKVKKENYTAVQVAELKAKFNSATSFDQQKARAVELSEEWKNSHTPRQILAKLQHLARTTPDNSVVYFKKVYEPKQAGVTVLKKSLLVTAIADKIGCDDEPLASLEGATKSALMLVLGSYDNFAKQVEVLEAKINTLETGINDRDTKIAELQSHCDV